MAGFRLRDLGLELAVRGPPMRVELDRLSFASPAGGTVQAHGALTGSGSARVRLQLDRLATSGLVPPYLRPLVGGTAQGWLAARADLRAPVLRPRGDGPQARSGPARPAAAHDPAGDRVCRPAVAAPEDALLGSLQGVRYQRGTLTVREAAARAFGAQVSASGSLQTRRPGAGRPRPASTPA